MDTRALSKIAPPTRDIAASFARRGIAASAPPRPCHFRSRLRRRGDLVALSLDGLYAGLFRAWISRIFARRRFAVELARGLMLWARLMAAELFRGQCWPLAIRRK